MHNISVLSTTIFILVIGGGVADFTVRSLGRMTPEVWENSKSVAEEILSATNGSDSVSLLMALRKMVKIIEQVSDTTTNYVGVETSDVGYKFVAGKTRLGHNTGFGISLTETFDEVAMIVSDDPVISGNIIVSDLGDAEWSSLPLASRYGGIFQAPKGFKKLLRLDVPYGGIPTTSSCDFFSRAVVQESKRIGKLRKDELIVLPAKYACLGQADHLAVKKVMIGEERVFLVDGIIRTNKETDIRVPLSSVSAAFGAMLNDKTVLKSLFQREAEEVVAGERVIPDFRSGRSDF